MLDVERKGAPGQATGAVKDIRHFIGGEFVPGAGTFENRSPVDARLLGLVSEAGAAEVDAAVKAARAALAGPWGVLDWPSAPICSTRWRTRSTGASTSSSRPRSPTPASRSSLAQHIDIPRGAANFKIFADVVKNVPSEFFQMATPDGHGAINYAIRVPKGVIAVICAVEPAAAADDLESGAGARLRQHRGGEAVGGDAADRDAAGRGDERGRRAQGRVQRGPRLRSGFGGRICSPAIRA